MTQADTPGRVLVVGESLIDIVDHGGRERFHVGGSPLNVSFGLARLGVETVFATEFADDDHGRMISEHLDGAGVTVVQTRTDKQRTSTARAVIGVDGSATYDFDLAWDFTDQPATEGMTVVHVGSVGALRPPGAYGVVDLLEELPPEVLVTFDPNIRPSLLPSHRQTSDLVQSFASRANVIKLSDEDAEWLFPDDPASAAPRLLQRGASMVAVTHGAEGSVIHTNDHVVAVPAFPVEVVDTIGAGDSYMSGLISAIVHGGYLRQAQKATFDVLQLTEIGRIAAAAAGITVGRSGANPPTLGELQSVIRIEWTGISNPPGKTGDTDRRWEGKVVGVTPRR